MSLRYLRPNRGRRFRTRPCHMRALSADKRVAERATEVWQRKNRRGA